jgi:hypothetical protein
MLVCRYHLVTVQTPTNNDYDVVEALIGAAYLHGGFDLGIECAQLFGLGLVWEKLSLRVHCILSRVETTDNFPTQTTDVERMLGYDFHRKLLLVEALTHASYQFDDQTISYERMEFLGDSGASSKPLVVWEFRFMGAPCTVFSIGYGGHGLPVSCSWQRI